VILSTIVLAAAGGESTDPWHVLGSSYSERLAIAALADLTLARRLTIAPAADDESPAARRLGLGGGPPLPGPSGVAFETLASVTRSLDVDRAVHALRDIAPAAEGELVATGAFVAAGEKGVFKKRTRLAARPEAVAWAQTAITRAATATAGGRALVLIATVGLPARRLARLCGGEAPPRLDPFEPFHPALPSSDGLALGHDAADLLTTLVVVLAATSDTTNDFD
jgi:hypothetical protein